MIKSSIKDGSVFVVSLSGTLEVSRQSQFKESLLKQVQSHPCCLVLDFKEVDFIDSACLGALISAARQLREKGGDIRLSEMNSEVTSVFQITRLDKVFKIFDKSTEAIASYSS